MEHAVIFDSVFHSGFPPHQAFNPFDDMDNMVQAQDSDEFKEFDQVGEKSLTEFLDQEEKESLEKNQFLEEEPMEEPHNTSVFSGISDHSIVLHNNRQYYDQIFRRTLMQIHHFSGINIDKPWGKFRRVLVICIVETIVCSEKSRRNPLNN